MTFPVSADQAPRLAPLGLANLKAAQARKKAGDTTNYGMSASVAPFTVEYPEGANVGYRWYQKTNRKPLFAFGYGLSYTRFSYGKPEVIGGTKPMIRLDVKNIGARAGADVPQIYVSAPDADGTAIYRLAGFTRVTLAPGETRRVEVPLEPRTFARYDAAQRGWIIDGKAHRFYIARAADAPVIEGVITPDAALLTP